jgi:hypothetical protein
LYLQLLQGLDRLHGVGAARLEHRMPSDEFNAEARAERRLVSSRGPNHDQESRFSMVGAGFLCLKRLMGSSRRIA